MQEPATNESLKDADPEILASALDVHRHLSLEDQAKALLDAATRMCPTEVGFVYLPGENPGVLVETLANISRMDPRRRCLAKVPADQVRALIEGKTERVLDGLGPFLSPNVPWPGEGEPRSIVFPLGDGEELAGVMLLVNPGSAEPSSRVSLHRLLELARPAIANGIRVGAMKELIILDDTAQCFNRRHFEESLPEELSRAKRFKSSLSLIFFDLDNLKLVNSRHGHAMGSRTLYEVSGRVRSRIRKFDKLFRFGGDEFVILLPETEWHGALEVAERVRESIAGNRFLVGLVSERDGIKMTASFGIASYPLHARTREDIVQRADRAMQRIKTGTKNSIAIAEILGDEDGS